MTTTQWLRLIVISITSMVFASCGGTTHELGRAPDAGGTSTAGSTGGSTASSGTAAGGSPQIDAPVAGGSAGGSLAGGATSTGGLPAAGGSAGGSPAGGATSTGGSASRGGTTASAGTGGSSAAGGAGGSSSSSIICCNALYCPSGYTLLGTAGSTTCPVGSECQTFTSCGCNLVLCAKAPEADAGVSDAAGGSGGTISSSGGSGGTGGMGGRGGTSGTGGAGTGGTHTGGAGGASTGGTTTGGAGGSAACQQAAALDQSCGVDSDCLAVRHTTSCCGASVWLGINKAGAQEYSTLESVCDASYPACGCASGPPTTSDDSSIPLAANVAVTCQGGVCKTYASACGHLCETGRSCITCGQGDAGVSVCSLRCPGGTGCTEAAYSKCESSFNGGVCVAPDLPCTGY